MSRAYCNICGNTGVGVFLYTRLRWLAKQKKLTVSDPANPKAGDDAPTNNTAHEGCYRALEKLASVPRVVKG